MRNLNATNILSVKKNLIWNTSLHTQVLTSFIFFFHLTQIKHIWQLIFCAWKSGWASSQPSVSNFLSLHEACSNFVHQNLSQFFQLMNVYPVSNTAVFEIQMLWTAQVDRCLKVFANTGRQHLFLFKLQTKMFSFSSYVTTETTSNRQIPSSDIRNPISMEHGSNTTPVPFQPAWKSLPTYLESKPRNLPKEEEAFWAKKNPSALTPAATTLLRANAILFHIKSTPCL